jgi:hypothetical protein
MKHKFTDSSEQALAIKTIIFRIDQHNQSLIRIFCLPENRADIIASLQVARVSFVISTNKTLTMRLVVI